MNDQRTKVLQVEKGKGGEAFSRLKVLVDRFNGGQSEIVEKIKALGHIDGGASVAELAAFGERALPFLLRELKNEDPQVRMNCIEAINRMKRSGGLAGSFPIPFLSVMLYDEEGVVRDLAITAIKAFGNDALPALIRVLFSKNKDARLCAVWGIRDLRAQASIKMLLRAYWREEDQFVKSEIASAISEIEGRPLTEGELAERSNRLIEVDQFVKRMVGEMAGGSKEAALAAIDRLIPLGEDAIIPLVWYGLMSEDKRVRDCSAAALSGIGSELAIPLLVAKLHDRDTVKLLRGVILGFGSAASPWLLLLAEQRGMGEETRAEALRLIGDAGDGRCLPFLSHFLASNEPLEVRRAAADAMLQIDGRIREESKKELAEMARDFFGS